MSLFNVGAGAADIEIPGEYIGDSNTAANANQTSADMSSGYKKIVLDVPFYCQRQYADCAISSVSMIEAYKKGYDSNDRTVYNAVINYNASVIDEGLSDITLQRPWKLGYNTLVENSSMNSFLSNGLSAIYEQLQHDNPVLIYRLGNGDDHFSVIYGYNGSSSELQAEGFLVWCTYHTEDYTLVGPGTIGYSNLKAFCSLGTSITTYYRTGNAIPLADKTAGSSMFNEVWASNIQKTNARIECRIPDHWITDCGFYIGTSESDMRKISEKKSNLGGGNGVGGTEIGFTMNTYGVSLTENTKYYYSFYFVSGGTTYSSKTYSFYTGINSEIGEEGTDNISISWSKKDDEYSVGETNAILAHWGQLSGVDNSKVSTVGCYLYDSDDNLLSQTSESTSGKMDGASSIWIRYNVNEHLNCTLTPGTTYKYKFYAVINGKTYYSPMQEFTTTESSNPIIVSGTCGADGDNLTWELTEDGTLTISGMGNMMDWTKTSNPDNAPWYSWRSSITKVVMESGVTSVGGEAFAKCTNLTSITIPEGVTSIGGNAFMSCETLANITLPESLTYINTLAFQSCTALSNITIPANVDYIFPEVFRACNKLVNIYVDSDNSRYCDVDGVLFNKRKTELHTYPAGKTASAYVIPSSVITIGQYAFQLCKNLTSIKIPDSVTTIKGVAFASCTNLASITIPESVTSLGDYAFSYCTNLTSITIVASVTNIGVDAFENCSNLTIYGYAGSTAETYANANNIPFVTLNTTVTGVTLNKTSATIDVGDTLNLTATVSPSDATVKTVTWTSSDPSVATVVDGTVTALKSGTTTITVTTVDGAKTATCVVTVKEAPVIYADVIYTIGSAFGKPGSTVEVALSVSSDVAVNGLLLDNLSYDENALEFVEFAEYGDLITTSALGANGVDSAKGEIALGYTDAVIPNGQICIIKFRVKDTAEDGEYTINIDGAASANGQKLTSEVNSGKITVSKWTSGDFDYDEKLDMKDVVYFMNWINFSWTGRYPMGYEGDKDFNKDGNVDMKDVVYFMNWVNFSWTGNYDINW